MESGQPIDPGPESTGPESTGPAPSRGQAFKSKPNSTLSNELENLKQLGEKYQQLKQSGARDEELVEAKDDFDKQAEKVKDKLKKQLAQQGKAEEAAESKTEAAKGKGALSYLIALLLEMMERPRTEEMKKQAQEELDDVKAMQGQVDGYDAAVNMLEANSPRSAVNAFKGAPEPVQDAVTHQLQVDEANGEPNAADAQGLLATGGPASGSGNVADSGVDHQVAP